MKIRNLIFNIKEFIILLFLAIKKYFKKFSVMNRISFCFVSMLILFATIVFVVKFYEYGNKDHFASVPTEYPTSQQTKEETTNEITSIFEESSLQEQTTASEFSSFETNSVTSQVVEVTTQSTVETVSKEDTIKRDEDAYLNDAVFIGDSITEGLKFYLGALDTKILSAKSLNPDTIFTAKVDCPDGEKRTILKGLETIEFSKVYILIGTNGIAFMEKNYMISQLSKFIDDIKKIKPNCAIYLQSMTPVTKKKYESDNRFSLENISQYNLQLKELSLKKQIYYLDINSLFSGQDGYLPSDQSPDGIHFYKNQYKTWYEFILTHTDRVFQFKT